MYRQLARWFQEERKASTSGPPTQADLQAEAMRVFTLHPMQLSRFLEEVWHARSDRRGRPAAELPPAILDTLRADIEGRLPNVTTDIYPFNQLGPGAAASRPRALQANWHHLIYAYMIENTRIFEIFGRVLHEYLHGEVLEIASADGQKWLRATEDLFFRDAPSFQISTLTSWERPDLRASRREAFYALFAMDLNHGTLDNRPYPYVKRKAANTDFVSTFEEFLREVWRGIENSTNTSGINATDDAAIANLAQQLLDMLRARRRNGNLSREEFVHVATMSWFHLTVEFDSPIVADLKAEAPSPEERLRRIGERVGLPAHGRSESYFILAEAVSRILIDIELGLFNSPANVRALYAPPTSTTPNGLRADILTIITHWSIATGRDLKAGKVTVSPRTGAPRAPAPGPNGVGAPAAPVAPLVG